MYSPQTLSTGFSSLILTSRSMLLWMLCLGATPSAPLPRNSSSIHQPHTLVVPLSVRPTASCNISLDPSMSSLPFELLRDIFETIRDLHTLFTLALVCKAFSAEAARILYQAPRDLTPARHVNFLRSLMNNPGLAALVQRYALPGMVGPHRVTAWELLRIVLPSMANMTDLSLLATSAELRILPLSKMTCQLERLSWIMIDMGPNNEFVLWLETQRQLKHLRWIYRDKVTISRTALPRLESLEGNSHVVEALLPCRTIRQLHWIPDSVHRDAELSERTKYISTGLEKLRWLTFENRFNTVELGLLTEHLTGLTWLELVGCCHKQDIPGLPVPPNVHTLIISYGPARSDKPVIPHDTRARIISQLFDRASKLARIDIAEKKGPKNVVLYERWQNRVRIETLLSYDEVHAKI